MSKNGDKIACKDVQFLVGVVAIAIPFVLIIGHVIHHTLYGGAEGFEIVLQGSLSRYYYTRMRDLFVGALITQGVYLITYIGYSDEDNKIGNRTGILAILTAVLPTGDEDVAKVPQNFLHVLVAFLFTLHLAYFCLVLFRRTDQTILNPKLPKKGFQRLKKEATRRLIFKEPRSNHKKIQRNKVYWVCGWVVLIAVFLTLSLNFIDWKIYDLDRFYYALWLESVASIAFGIALFVKSGKGPLQD